MHTRTTRLLTTSLAVVLSTGIAQAAKPDFAAVHTAVSDAIAAKTVPGAIVAIRQNGKLVYQEAQGNTDATPLKVDSVFWVASMTKPVVASTVMMLVDDGKIRLDDPVSKYIPEFAKPRQVRSLPPGVPMRAAGGMPGGPPPPALPWQYEPAKRALTVRDMITMTGGLQTIGVPGATPPVSDTDTVASWVAKLADTPLDFQPGSRWGYSNATEFEVAVRLVEVASGEGYASFVQRRLFDPLGMKDTAFGIRDDLRVRVSASMGDKLYIADGKRFTSGSAGLWTTAEDYSKFAQMLLDGGKAPNGKRLLGAKSVQAMHTNQIGGLSLGGVNSSSYGGMPEKTNAAVKYGYGLNVILDAQAAGLAVPTGSYGWDGVGTRRFWVMPKHKAVLVMLVPGGKADDLHRAIEGATVAALGK